MKAMMQSKVGLMFVLVAFLVIVVVSSVSLKGGRIDLTENNLYTLSDGSKNIVQNLEQSVKLTLYFSDKATKELPAVRTYAQRVKELLQEYQSLSRGKIEFQVVDPAPFSEEEDAASAAGLQGVPAGLRGDEIYFGLVGESVAGGESSEAAAASGDPLNLAKNEEVIPFFQLDKEKFLEYDLTKLIFNLSQTEPPTLGIISGIPINGGFDYATRQNQPAWVVVQQMEDLFQLEWLSEDVTAIDDNIDILMLNLNR